MKNLIILLFPMMLNAQGIQVSSISPTVLCPGDSLRVSYTIKPGNILLNLIGSEASQVWQYDYSVLVNQPFKVSNVDTVYTITLKTIKSLGKSPAILKANGKDFLLDFSCELTGINGNTLEAPQPIYFDLNGRQIDKKADVILIEQRGIFRRKIFIQ